MATYKLHPKVFCCSMRGNRILEDHSVEVHESSFFDAEELVKKGFLIKVEEKPSKKASKKEDISHE